MASDSGWLAYFYWLCSLVQLTIAKHCTTERNGPGLLLFSPLLVTLFTSVLEPTWRNPQQAFAILRAFFSSHTLKGFLVFWIVHALLQVLYTISYCSQSNVLHHECGNYSINCHYHNLFSCRKYSHKWQEMARRFAKLLFKSTAHILWFPSLGRSVNIYIDPRITLGRGNLSPWASCDLNHSLDSIRQCSNYDQ